MRGIAGGLLLGIIFAFGVLALFFALRPTAFITRLRTLTARQGSQSSLEVWMQTNTRSIAPGFVSHFADWLGQGLRQLWSDNSVRERLSRAGNPTDLTGFRIAQLRAIAIGAAVAVGFGVLRTLSGEAPPAPLWLIFTGVCGLAGASWVDLRLTMAAAKRCRGIETQLPDVAELLAFTVTAGVSPAAGLLRLTNRMQGPLIDELRIATREIANGALVADALGEMADRISSRPLQRFVDGIVIAIERGTPIAEVLRAQAMDARSEQHRRLMESAGKREIMAMVPVVFLILPVVIVVAVYPGIYGLTLMV
ncbi:MAG: type II secretion system F family protein [Candidatus Nanopelagicales bacterium]